MEATMTNKQTGGSAFPVHPSVSTINDTAWLGMTLRDYFAAQALTGAQIWDAVLNGKNSPFAGGVDKLAEVAYTVADAMLKARDGNP
jgi:hypothetical protein